jgi:3-deoxy-D-manno-octulosonic-acid transferase
MKMRVRIFLWMWSLLWSLGTPLIMGYLFLRARKDKAYGAKLAERFGVYKNSAPADVWLHAVSLGELRSAVPLIIGFLSRKERVVVTTFTPAGRQEAERVFASAIAEGQLAVVWVPVETAWAWRRFLRQFHPRFGLVMEIEIWPRMVFAARAAHVPLFMCNAQYPSKSIKRDSNGLRLRQHIMSGFAGAFVKSELQARRFEAVGVQNIAITGELRFDQPVPQALVSCGIKARRALGLEGKRVVAFVSTIEGEDPVYIEAMKALLALHDDIVFVYVPRRPERFEQVRQTVASAGLEVVRRSDIFPDELSAEAQFTPLPSGTQVIFGDSLGEMYFYLTLAQSVVVGGGFSPKGAHNIIEPLALGKPVFTGPETFTIEYPFAEAAEAGVARSVVNARALVAALEADDQPTEAQIQEFFSEHSRAVPKFFAALPDLFAVAEKTGR